VRALGEAEWDGVAAGTDPVAALFWAEWCLPSRTALAALEAAAAGRWRAVSVNVDESGGLARRLGIAGLPTLLLLARGSERARRIGLVPPDDLPRLLEGALTAASQ
jgi:thioredoxin-like negative regulator of GroEL